MFLDAAIRQNVDTLLLQSLDEILLIVFATMLAAQPKWMTPA
jgi:hypothetical protein